MDRLSKIIKKVIIETTSDSRGSRGSYVTPLLPGYREFEKNQMAPFTEYVTDWDDASLDHDSLDGKMSADSKTIQRKEKKAEKIQKFIKNNPDKFAWSDDAGIMNSLPFHNTDAKPIKNYDPKKTTVSLGGVVKQITKKIKESTGDSGGSRGSYIAPLQPGLRPFTRESLQPFTDAVSKWESPLVQYDSYDGSWDLRLGQIKELEKTAAKIQDYIKHHPYSTFSDDDGNIINQYFQDSKKTPYKEKMEPYTIKVNEWIEISDKGTINEDLAVWFGKKNKPKGSSQPKGPWVNICSKVDGKHPPCGRQDTSKGSYPKCRAAGVAGKMSDSAKRSACQQKRSAEKKDTQTGKGQKPIMTSYKTKKESIDSLVGNILFEIRNLV